MPFVSPLVGPKVEELLDTAGKNRRVVMPTHSLQQVAQHTGERKRQRCRDRQIVKDRNRQTDSQIDR